MLNWTFIIISAAIIEAITLIGRLAFDINIRRWFQQRMKKNRKLIRIHHSFWGGIMAIFAFLISWGVAFNLGVALVCSDFIHHMMLMANGDSEFKNFIEVY